MGCLVGRDEQLQERTREAAGASQGRQQTGRRGRLAQGDQRARHARRGITLVAQCRRAVVLGDRRPEILPRGEGLAGVQVGPGAQVAITESGQNAGVTGIFRGQVAEGRVGGSQRRDRVRVGRRWWLRAVEQSQLRLAYEPGRSRIVRARRLGALLLLAEDARPGGRIGGEQQQQVQLRRASASRPGAIQYGVRGRRRVVDGRDLDLHGALWLRGQHGERRPQRRRPGSKAGLRSLVEHRVERRVPVGVAGTVADEGARQGSFRVQQCHKRQGIRLPQRRDGIGKYVRCGPDTGVIRKARRDRLNDRGIPVLRSCNDCHGTVRRPR